MIFSRFVRFLLNRFQKYLTICEVPHFLLGVRKGADQANCIGSSHDYDFENSLIVLLRKFLIVVHYVSTYFLSLNKECTNILA